MTAAGPQEGRSQHSVPETMRLLTITEKELKKLRAYFHAMSGMARILTEVKSSGPATVVDRSTYEMIASEVNEIATEFPGILPPFDRQDFFAHDVGRGPFYRLDGLKLYVAKAVGRLNTAVEETESTPVTQVRSFKYVADEELRAIVARDYGEVQRAFVAKCWKSAIIISGGIIEALLLDLLDQNQTAALSAKAAPPQNDLRKWALSSLIDVAVELKLVSEGVEKLSHPVREYRNLIHPGVELRKKMKFDGEEARIALEVLHILDRDMS